MSALYNRVYDEADAMVRNMLRDDDPVRRLSNIHRLTSDMRRILMDARDEAAYELRSQYASLDAEALVGVSARYIDYWANRWQRRRDLPRLKRRRRIDLSAALDLRP